MAASTKWRGSDFDRRGRSISINTVPVTIARHGALALAQLAGRDHFLVEPATRVEGLLDGAGMARRDRDGAGWHRNAVSFADGVWSGDGRRTAGRDERGGHRRALRTRLAAGRERVSATVRISPAGTRNAVDANALPMACAAGAQAVRALRGLEGSRASPARAAGRAT